MDAAPFLAPFLPSESGPDPWTGRSLPGGSRDESGGPRAAPVPAGRSWERVATGTGSPGGRAAALATPPAARENKAGPGGEGAGRGHRPREAAGARPSGSKPCPGSGERWAAPPLAAGVGGGGEVEGGRVAI